VKGIPFSRARAIAASSRGIIVRAEGVTVRRMARYSFPASLGRRVLISAKGLRARIAKCAKCAQRQVSRFRKHPAGRATLIRRDISRYLLLRRCLRLETLNRRDSTRASLEIFFKQIAVSRERTRGPLRPLAMSFAQGRVSALPVIVSLIRVNELRVSNFLPDWSLVARLTWISPSPS